MAADLQLRGIYVPIITPFTENDEVTVGAIEELCNGCLDAGAAGIVALGTTGEPATLTAVEKARVVDAASRICRERDAQFIVGVGTNNTAEAVELIHHANGTNRPTAILSVVPYYTRPSEQGVIEHFEVLARESEAPLIVYNIPYRTGRGLGATSLLELASVPNIAGVKQAVGGVDADTLELLADKPAGFEVLCGDDPYLYPLLALGATGAIAASAHVFTEYFVEMVSCVESGDHIKARTISERLLPVTKALFAEPSPSVLKGVLAMRGRIDTPNLRLPMTTASSTSTEAALEAFEVAERFLTESAAITSR